MYRSIQGSVLQFAVGEYTVKSTLSLTLYKHFLLSFVMCKLVFNLNLLCFIQSLGKHNRKAAPRETTSSTLQQQSSHTPPAVAGIHDVHMQRTTLHCYYNNSSYPFSASVKVYMRHVA